MSNDFAAQVHRWTDLVTFPRDATVEQIRAYYLSKGCSVELAEDMAKAATLHGTWIACAVPDTSK